MSERIRGSYANALYKSTYTLLYTINDVTDKCKVMHIGHKCDTFYEMMADGVVKQLELGRGQMEDFGV